jgi:hypothetical protein
MRFIRTACVATAQSLAAIACTANAHAGAALTNHGQLKCSGESLNGNIDVHFALFGSATGGAPLFHAAKKFDVPAANGLLTIVVNFFDCLAYVVAFDERR